MGQFIEDLQYKLKTSSSSIALLAFKLIVGLVLGLVLALVGQQMVNYGDLSFLLVVIVALSAFFRIAKAWRWAGVSVFALLCVLLALLLNMYIMVAPGA
jgi:uncharacterized membrane protein YccC